MARNPKEAYGYGQRSGKLIPLRKARYDGIKTGLRDSPEWVDDDHPQRHPIDVFDNPALYNPLPPNERHDVTVFIGRMVDETDFSFIQMPMMTCTIGGPSLPAPTVLDGGWGAYGWGADTAPATNDGWGGA